MFIRCALIGTLVFLGTAGTAVLAQEGTHRTDFVGLTCATVNAMSPEVAAGFLYGYEAGFMDAVDPEGPTSGIPSTAAAGASGAVPDTTTIVLEACRMAPDALVAQALADRHAVEDPIELVNMMRTAH